MFAPRRHVTLNSTCPPIAFIPCSAALGSPPAHPLPPTEPCGAATSPGQQSPSARRLHLLRPELSPLTRQPLDFPRPPVRAHPTSVGPLPRRAFPADVGATRRLGIGATVATFGIGARHRQLSGSHTAAIINLTHRRAASHGPAQAGLNQNGLRAHRLALHMRTRPLRSPCATAPGDGRPPLRWTAPHSTIPCTSAHFAPPRPRRGHSDVRRHGVCRPTKKNRHLAVPVKWSLTT